jgi:hypothetical protein
MAKLGELTGPVMRLHRMPPALPCNSRMGCEEIQKLSSTNPLEYRSTPLIRSVNVKDILGDIQTDYEWCSTPPLWHIDAMPSGGVHPIMNCSRAPIFRISKGLSDLVLSQEFENEVCNLIVLFIQGEMAGIEQVDFGVR